MKKIALIEKDKNSYSRGFLSNYTTILTSFRYLTQTKNVDPADIFISDSMFSLYGSPKNWFDSNIVVDSFNDNYDSHHSIIGFDLSIWPTSSELNLSEYIDYIPFNIKIKKLLAKDKTDYSNTLGIHYRGTDNRGNTAHTDYLPLDKIIESSDEEFSKNSYDSIFICTDENGVIEKIKVHFLEKYNFTNINYFDHIRTDGEIPLHFKGFSEKEKVLLGDQVLIDSTTLSKCKTIIGKTSNIINYARVINPKLEVLYQDLDTVKMNGSLTNKFLQIRTCEIQPFIFNWKNQFEKTCTTEESLKKIFDKVIIINSDEENTRDGWVNIGDSAYFTEQFTKALELFEGDKKVLMHVQGDTVYNNYKQLVEDAKKYYSIYEWGIYAPDITNVWYTSEIVDINEVQSEHENIKMVACTDETVWFIHRDIIEDYYKRGLSEVMTSEKMKMGWGWDLVMNSISFISGRPVIRDYDHEIQHEKGTNYNKDAAHKEMENLMRNLPDDLRECITYIKGDREQLAKYF